MIKAKVKIVTLEKSFTVNIKANDSEDLNYKIENIKSHTNGYCNHKILKIIKDD